MLYSYFVMFKTTWSILPDLYLLAYNGEPFRPARAGGICNCVSPVLLLTKETKFFL